MGATQHASFDSAGKTPALTEIFESDIETIGVASLFTIESKPVDIFHFKRIMAFVTAFSVISPNLNLETV